MYVIMVYDVNEKRVAKALKIGRKYLNWVQNSVLEGELTRAKYERLKREIKSTIKTDEDSVIFYTFESSKYTSREIIGKEKGSPDVFI